MESKLARCQILATVIAADGVIHPAEKAFLNHLMSQLGLSSQQQAEVMSLKYVDEAEKQAIGLSRAEKRLILDEAVAAVLIDGRLAPEEKAVIDRLSKLFGFQD